MLLKFEKANFFRELLFCYAGGAVELPLTLVEV